MSGDGRKRFRARPRKETQGEVTSLPLGDPLKVYTVQISDMEISAVKGFCGLYHGARNHYKCHPTTTPQATVQFFETYGPILEVLSERLDSLDR